MPELRVDQVAVMLGVHRCHVYWLISHGHLAAVKPHRTWRITPRSLETYMRSRAKLHGKAVGRVTTGNPDYDKWYPWRKGG
jgi:excisionase family DNA binding protein